MCGLKIPDITKVLPNIHLVSIYFPQTHLLDWTLKGLNKMFLGDSLERVLNQSGNYIKKTFLSETTSIQAAAVSEAISLPMIS